HPPTPIADTRSPVLPRLRRGMFHCFPDCIAAIGFYPPRSTEPILKSRDRQVNQSNHLDDCRRLQRTEPVAGVLGALRIRASTSNVLIWACGSRITHRCTKVLLAPLLRNSL